MQLREKWFNFVRGLVVVSLVARFQISKHMVHNFVDRERWGGNAHSKYLKMFRGEERGKKGEVIARNHKKKIAQQKTSCKRGEFFFFVLLVMVVVVWWWYWWNGVMLA